MLADVINAGTGARARQPGLHAAGGRQDRHDQRFQRRVVRRLHAEAGRRRLGRLRSAAHDPAQRVRGDVAVPLWATFMKAATANDKPEWFTPPSGVTTATRLPAVRQAGGRRVRSRRGRSTRMVSSRSGRWSTPSTSRAAPSRPTYCDMHSAREAFGAVAAVFRDRRQTRATRHRTTAPAPDPDERLVSERQCRHAPTADRFDSTSDRRNADSGQTRLRQLRRNRQARAQARLLDGASSAAARTARHELA